MPIQAFTINCHLHNIYIILQYDIKEVTSSLSVPKQEIQILASIFNQFEQDLLTDYGVNRDPKGWISTSHIFLLRKATPLVPGNHLSPVQDKHAW